MNASSSEMCLFGPLKNHLPSINNGTEQIMDQGVVLSSFFAITREFVNYLLAIYGLAKDRNKSV